MQFSGFEYVRTHFKSFSLYFYIETDSFLPPIFFALCITILFFLGGPRDSSTTNVDALELYRQLKYWQCLRQDLERARLLCELVRKREKLKVEFIKAKERCLKVELKPLEACMRKVLAAIRAKDVNEIFCEPVDLEEVPDYTTVISQPMDLRTMGEKLDAGSYSDLAAMEKDFDLMIANCLAYNNKDTVFYKY